MYVIYMYQITCFVLNLKLEIDLIFDLKCT